jgi:hypothetical protein
MTHKAYARIGFLGNPSDGYYGKTISFLLENFSATVSLEPSDTLKFVPSQEHDPQDFPSLEALVSHLDCPRVVSRMLTFGQGTPLLLQSVVDKCPAAAPPFRIFHSLVYQEGGVVCQSAVS